MPASPGPSPESMRKAEEITAVASIGCPDCAGTHDLTDLNNAVALALDEAVREDKESWIIVEKLDDRVVELEAELARVRADNINLRIANEVASRSIAEKSEELNRWFLRHETLRSALERIAKSYIEDEEKRPTSEWSMGNYDDVFSDGITMGEHYQAEIARAALSSSPAGVEQEKCCEECAPEYINGKPSCSCSCHSTETTGEEHSALAALANLGKERRKLEQAVIEAARKMAKEPGHAAELLNALAHLDALEERRG